MDITQVLTGIGAAASLGVTLLIGGRYMVRAELSTFKVSFVRELNGTYTRKGIHDALKDRVKTVERRIEGM